MHANLRFAGALCRFCDQQIGLLLRPPAAPGRSATSSVRWCTTTRAALGWFGWWHGATARRLAALAAAMPGSCSGIIRQASSVRRPAGPDRCLRNGVRFLQRYGHHGGCKWCGTVLSIPADGAVTLTLLLELLVAVLQVDEVGEFSGREIADFRGASGPEMERQMAKKWVYGTLKGTAHLSRTMD